MKDAQIQIQLEQLALELEKEINCETDCERNCRLHDAKEYLRRAWYVVEGSPLPPCECNDLLTVP